MHNQFQLTLATDLDGTFLEGNNDVKRYFYQELDRLRERIMLIYVTGRTIEAVEQFCRIGALPVPHYIIADHGTQIIDGINFRHVEHLQKPIIKKWNNASSLLKALLCKEPGIQLQPIDPPYRVAYYYEPDLLQQSTLDKISDNGCDAILSCDTYLDIVPKGVNKGSSLINLLNDRNIKHESVVTSGDSLNDLSLFQTGLKSIAVGNSELKLVNAIRKLQNVYHSAFPGLLGIMDGLQFFKQTELFI